MGALDEILKDPPSGGRHKAQPPKDAEVDEVIELPEPGSPYQAFARPSNKPVYTIHLDLGPKGWVSFQYVQLDGHSEFRSEAQGQIIRLRFAGTKIWDVLIGGIALFHGYDLIGQHRMSWIRLNDRGFAAAKDREPLITSLQIKEIEREG